MRLRAPRLTFRFKVVLFAVVLVTAIQLGTLFPVLNEARQWQQNQADRSVELAGVVFDEYMLSRSEQMALTVSALALDYGFRDTVASGDVPSIEGLLKNHARRAGMETAAIFELDGSHLASTGGGRALFPRDAMARFDADPTDTDPVVSVGFIDDRPYHAVTVPVEAPVPIAWATLGLPIDDEFVEEIGRLTGLDSTIVGFGVGSKTVYATTLAGDVRDAALADVRLGDAADRAMSLSDAPGWLTQLRPYRDESDGIYVALQLPIENVLADYGAMRNEFIATFSVALLLTVAAAVWLSSMVTSPIGRLVDAAQRMADGIYSKPIEIRSRDEFAVLAQGFNSMQQAIANREQDIVHMAHHDSLSGLPTREIIVSEIRDAIAETDQLAIINFVMHRFDELAASLGHRTADRLIQLVAGRLRDRLREGELLGHLNHQEFVVVLPDADHDQAEDYVRDLQAMLRSGVAVGNANISLQIRAGISLFPDHGINASELLRCAGIARGHASHHLGSVGVYEPGQEERSLGLIQIVGDFPRALTNRELWVEYQPKIDCQSLAVTGAEALTRWHHPKLGRLAPDTFVEAIEQAGGISQLTRWVLEEAASTLAGWRSQGLKISMSANISPDDLMDRYLPPFLESLCQRHGIDPGSLTLEVTESSIMRNVENSLSVINAIRRLGFRVAIDDFGTGHSALAQLKRLPVDELKIDKSFVLNIDDQRDEAVVRTAIELAHKFGLAAVAEGVEDEACLTRLTQLGCESAQGFFISQSLPPDEFVAWARAWRGAGGADIVSLIGEGEKSRSAGR
ncbi:MAG TPA: EAL domain-containing protein [Gammaproteobacteria bacterium]|nr:EAL domain-containing protein [Gammaproteobacteria bacterium]